MHKGLKHLTLAVIAALSISASSAQGSQCGPVLSLLLNGDLLPYRGQFWDHVRATEDKQNVKYRTSSGNEKLIPRVRIMSGGHIFEAVFSVLHQWLKDSYENEETINNFGTNGTASPQQKEYARVVEALRPTAIALGLMKPGDTAANSPKNGDPGRTPKKSAEELKSLGTPDKYTNGGKHTLIWKSGTEVVAILWPNGVLAIKLPQGVLGSTFKQTEGHVMRVNDAEAAPDRDKNPLYTNFVATVGTQPIKYPAGGKTMWPTGWDEARIKMATQVVLYQNRNNPNYNVSRGAVMGTFDGIRIMVMFEKDGVSSAFPTWIQDQ